MAWFSWGSGCFGRGSGNGNGNGNGYCRVEEFRLFRSSVETQVELLRDRIDSRHLALIQKLEELQAWLTADAERRAEATGRRLGQVEGAVERLDERTSHKLRVES